MADIGLPLRRHKVVPLKQPIMPTQEPLSKPLPQHSEPQKPLPSKTPESEPAK